MGRKCSICTHPKRAHINRALLSGKKSVRQIASQYGVNYGSVCNHKNRHLHEAMIVAKVNGQVAEGKSAYEQFMDMVNDVKRKYEKAKGHLQVQWFAQYLRVMELSFKLGIEEERRREKTAQFKDVTPGVLSVIERIEVTIAEQLESEAEEWVAQEGENGNDR